MRGRTNFQKIGFGVHGGGEDCGCHKPPKHEYTPAEVNALLDKLAELLKGEGEEEGSDSQAPSLEGVEYVANRINTIRGYEANEDGDGVHADNNHYPTEKAVAKGLYDADQNLGNLSREVQTIDAKVGSLDYFNERYVLPQEVLPLDSFTVGGIMKALRQLIALNANTIGGNIGRDNAAAMNETPLANMTIWQTLKALYDRYVQMSEAIREARQIINDITSTEPDTYNHETRLSNVELMEQEGSAKMTWQ